MKQLLHLYSIESVHPNEQEMSDYIISQLKELGADYSVNEYGITGDMPPVYETLKRLKFNENIQFFKKATIVDGLFVEKKVLTKSGLTDSKINRIIEDKLTEPTNVAVQYIYKGYNDNRGCIVDKETGEHISTETTAEFKVIYTQSGQIILKKVGGDETVIASV